MKKFVLSCVFVLFASICVAAEWGDVSGKFTFDGTPPKQEPVADGKDAFCMKQKIVIEELVVNPENKGIQNVIVYLYTKRGSKGPKVHPSYEETAKAEVHLDNEKCRFNPHITLLRTTQTLVVGNKDGTSHNASLVTRTPKNVIIPAGQSESFQFKRAETVPALVRCDVHPYMNGRLVIKDHPYMTVSDKDGNFEIKNLPVGEHTLQFYHEKCGYVKEAKVGGKTVKLKSGRLKLKVKSGKNDLGEYKLSKVFKGK